VSGVDSAASLSISAAPGAREDLKSVQMRGLCRIRDEVRHGRQNLYIGRSRIEDNLQGVKGRRLGWYLSARCQQDHTARQLRMRRGQHTGDTIAEVVSGHIRWPNFQSLAHTRYIVRKGIECDPLLAPLASASARPSK
jgi:hypothetical protein